MNMEEYKVFREDVKSTIYTIFNSDLTVLYNKRKGKLYILVPLTSNHRFIFDSNWLLVDEEKYGSNMYWRECGNQVIEYQGTVPKWLQKVMNEINKEVLKN